MYKGPALWSIYLSRPVYSRSLPHSASLCEQNSCRLQYWNQRIWAAKAGIQVSTAQCIANTSNPLHRHPPVHLSPSWWMGEHWMQEHISHPNFTQPNTHTEQVFIIHPLPQTISRYPAHLLTYFTSFLHYAADLAYFSQATSLSTSSALHHLWLTTIM